AEAGGEAMSAGLGGVFSGRQADLGPGGALLDINLKRLHVSEVEHEATLNGAVTGQAVAAAADGQLEPGLAGKFDCAGDIGRVGDASDQRGAAVEPAVEERAGLVIAGIGRRDHATGEP